MAGALAVAGLATLFSGAGTAGDGIPMRPAGSCDTACPGDRTPRWSPAGAQIAFSRYDPTGKRRAQTIWVYDLNRNRERLLLDPLVRAGVSPPYSGLAWSPDGSRLAFTNGYVYVLRTEGGGGPTRISPPTELGFAYEGFRDGLPTWSPGGERLAFVRSGVSVRGFGFDWCCQVHAAKADGTGSAVVLGGPAPAEPYTGAVWAPDGGLTVVVAARETSARSEIRHVRIGGEERVLVRGAVSEGFELLRWSADGRRVFFLSRTGAAERVKLEAVEADGNGRTSVLELPRPLDSCCLLSPDTTRAIIIGAGADEGAEVRIAELATGTERWVADGVSAQARPHLTSASWSPDGRRVAYLADGECPTVLAVHVIGQEGGARRRLTHPCRRTGTTRRDLLTGSNRPNALYGREGDDRLYGRGGPDVVDGGAGVDTVAGGAGDDRLYGGPGHDLIIAGDGWDAVYGRDGVTDTIRCGRGRDAVRADRLDVVARDCERVERE